MSQRLYAVVLRLAATRSGAISPDHGDYARAALLNLIRQGDSPLAEKLHDTNAHKPYTISLIQGGRHGRDKALHFGDGDTADWRFTLLMEPAFEALLQAYLLGQEVPHIRIGAVEFAVTEAFVSGTIHPDSGHTSHEALTDRWNTPPEGLPKHLTLDFRSPTAFSLGQDRETKAYRIRNQPDARTLFSTLRNKWKQMGGHEPGIEFDEWVGAVIETEPLRINLQRVMVKHRPVDGFVGQVRYSLHGQDVRWLSFLHLLSELSFWTGVGYQTTRGMGQARLVPSEHRSADLAKNS